MKTDFNHLYRNGDPSLPALLLLHGTGGNERDLLELGQTVSAGSALLSVRGKVLENGMPRFFRRLAEGVFDLQDLAFRTNELADFIGEERTEYGITQPLIALGYSNGANIAASMLLSRPDALDGAILLRGMMPFEPEALPDLSDKNILMLNGLMDALIPAENAQRLSALLVQAGAEVAFHLTPSTHAMTRTDVVHMTEWLQKQITAR